MMDVLNMIWDCGRGRAQIILDKFFPCTKRDLKKLLAVISLDWEHETEIKEHLKAYLQEKVTEHKGAKEESARQHIEYKQKEADAKEIVTTGKRPDGVPLSKDELKKEKEKLRRYKVSAGSHLSQYKQHQKNEKQFSEHLKLL